MYYKHIMSLTIDILQEIVNINETLLTVKEVLKLVNYEYNELYIDKFWDNIKSDKWLYIDNEMLKYIGYSDVDINSAKRTYLILLKDNFEEAGDYKLINSKEFLDIPKCAITHLENNEVNTHNKTKHLIVSPDCFKQSLMLLKTNKAKEIRKYYTELEKIFKFYLQYQSKYQELKNLETKKLLEEEKEKNKKHTFRLIQEKILELDEYIYIAASKNSSELNRFKIGRTKYIDTRVRGYNTGRADDDEFFYIYIMKCYDSESLEKMIFNKLSNFQYIDRYGKKGNEMYQIHYDTLIKIFKEFEQFEISNSQNLNKIFTEYYHTYQNTEPTKIEEIQIINIQEHINTKFNNDNIIVNTRSKLNNKNINENLESNGIRMISNYNGNYEEEMEFECLSLFKHKFKMTYAHIQSKKENACYYCSKHGI
jgi:hypothetical protein